MLLAAILAGAAQAAEPVVYGYLPYWEDFPGAVPWEEITHLAIFSVGVNSDGSLNNTSRWTGRAAGAVEQAAAHGVKVHLCVTAFDEDVQRSVLTSTTRRAALVEALGRQVDAYGADGVNVDFEIVPGDLREELVLFAEELKARVPEVTFATPTVDWDDAWDYAALSRISDGLFIMGYDLHGGWGDAGPVSTLWEGGHWGWISLEWGVDDYEDKGADLSKVWLGLPLYGHQWRVADADDIPADTLDSEGSVLYGEAVAGAAVHGRRWDDVGASPWYAPDGVRQVWYDDAESLGIKIAWAVHERGLGGTGFWALGYDEGDPALWAAVDAALVPPDPPFAALLLAASLPSDVSAARPVAPGEEVAGWFELENVGSSAWTPGQTFLAPLPRDVAAPWAAAAWPAPDRAATVEAVVPPGARTRLPVRVVAPAEAGTHLLTFGLVEDGDTWFADAPRGGGPADGALRVALEVRASGGGGGGSGEADGSGADTGGERRGKRQSAPVACAAAGGLPAAAALVAAAGGLVLRRRRTLSRA